LPSGSSKREARYLGIKVSVERAGAQRLFQRLSQEYESGIYNADVVNSADAAHFVLWAKRGWLAAYLPEDVTKYYDRLAPRKSSAPRNASSSIATECRAFCGALNQVLTATAVST
jgi:ABC-type Fe3+ transport system substrate-binding protein